MALFKSLSARLGKVLLVYGGWGLLGMSFLDSSFVPFPVFNDLALMLLAGRHSSHAALYALASTVGSVLGCYVIYGIARGGEKFLWRKATPSGVARAQRWLERNDFVTLLVGSLLPPPAPLKVFVLTAGVLRTDALRFGLAMFVGRSLRFGAEAWLGARYGAQAETYLRQNLGWTSLVTVAVVLAATLFYRRFTRRRGRASDASSDPPPSATD